MMSEHERAAIVMIDDNYFLPAPKFVLPEDFQVTGTNEPGSILECFFSKFV